MSIPRRNEPLERSRKQERATAERFGGRVQKASGAAYQKADVRAYGLVRVEAKATKHASFRVTEEMVRKLEADCFGADEVPVVEVGLSSGACRVYVVPAAAMELLLGLS